MSEDKKNDTVFLPLEHIAEIAVLRKEHHQARANEELKFNEVENSPAYIAYEKAKEAGNEIALKAYNAEVEYKANCVAIFKETEDKQFPGGKINLMTGLEFKEDLAIRYAINKDLPELLKLNLKEFKKISPRPAFITETKTPKLKMDTDLSAFLEGGGDG